MSLLCFCPTCTLLHQLYFDVKAPVLNLAESFSDRVVRTWSIRCQDAPVHCEPAAGVFCMNV